MPVYEFNCQGCGRRFEKLFRTMSDKPRADCPACGSKKTVRALSLVNAGESRSRSAGGSSAAEMPFCGRCGGPGPCGLDD